MADLVVDDLNDYKSNGGRLTMVDLVVDGSNGDKSNGGQLLRQLLDPLSVEGERLDWLASI